MLTRLRRLYHTLRPLRWQQFWYRAWYPVRKRFYTAPAISKDALYAAMNHEQRTFYELPAFDAYDPASRTFNLLNCRCTYPQMINWDEPRHGKLWTYHLNYFGWLYNTALSITDRLQTVREYTAAARQLKTGTDPYPVSLRGISWIRFFAGNYIKDEAAVRLLYRHYHRLYRFPEYQLQGNHLWENGCSLLYAGYYFKEERFWRRGKKILENALTDQLTADGGHTEGSPMYHSHALCRLLQCIEFSEVSGTFSNEDFRQLMRQKAALMLGWLQQVTFANTSWPMVNDATFLVAPSTKTLLLYGAALNILPLRRALKESGYRMLRKQNYELFIDAANITPAWQPGHAHADTFSFCLTVNGSPLIVDPGVSTYEHNERRHWQRSTTAHNTVSVGGINSSDVWKAFRVGRRATVRLYEDLPDRIRASHDGYTYLGITHERTFDLHENKIIIRDTLHGANEQDALLNLHFHPSLNLSRLDTHIFKIENLLLTFGNIMKATIETYNYAAGFNETLTGQRIAVTFRKAAQLTIEILHAD